MAPTHIMATTHRLCQPQIKRLGLSAYADAEKRMRTYTAVRDPQSPDEIWLTYHPPIYTLGQSGKLAHVLDAGDIPVVRTNRGGQVTYHGPGQVVAYVLIDLQRTDYGIRTLIRRLEQSMLDTLSHHGIIASCVHKRPGVYVGNAKLGAVGLRVSRGCTYHGLSLNVNCDLTPFAGINTCGYADLADTSMYLLGCRAPPAQIANELGSILAHLLVQPTS